MRFVGRASRSPIAAPLVVGLLVAGTLIGYQASSQRQALAQSNEQLIEKRAKKLAEPWLKKADWHTDYDAARAAARDQRKIIFSYFTRSYAP